jgi:Domain of unknown function (DUF4411)
MGNSTMPGLYCLDASFFINGWQKRYRIDVFPGLWAEIDKHLVGGAVCSCRAVLEEISEKDDGLHQWVKRRANSFHREDRDQLLAMQGVMSKFPNFAATSVSASSVL